VNGSVGLVVARRGRLLLVLKPIVKGGRIVEIEAIADPVRLSRLHLSVLDG
jgi:RNA polymerase sigma-70 factor (ECF subfamily)